MQKGIVTGIFDLLKGFIMGIAQIIPGVSGGTLALIMGIYEKFILSINHISKWLLSLLKYIKTFDKSKWNESVEKFKKIDLKFIICLFSGMFLAIILTSSLITYFLDNYHSQTYGMFFGLIIASIIVPWGKMEKKSWKELIAFIFGFIFLFIVSGISMKTPVKINQKSFETKIDHLVKDTDKNTLKKYYTLNKQDNVYFINDNLNKTEEKEIKKILQKVTSPSLVFVFIGGAISISAMILPGLSGSFVLLIFGLYGYIIGLINKIKIFDLTAILPLIIFSIGLIVGLFSFAKFLEFLLKKYHSVTMAFLIGLMLGSLRKIFPFDNIANIQNTEIFSIIVSIVIGVLLVLFLYFISREKVSNEQA